MNRKSALLILIATTLGVSCQKNTSLAPDEGTTQSEAIITGIDITTCGCCGGYELDLIDNPPNNLSLLTSELPKNSGINNYSNFPIYVTINWKYDSTSCNNRIIITGLKKK